MGLASSRLSGYTNVMMMNTDAHLHFKDTLQKQWTTAAAAARMEVQQSQAATGSGAVAGTARGWGMGFYGISTAIYAFSMFGIPLGLILIGIIYAVGASQAAMAISIFIATFFFVFAMLFHAPIARAGITSGTNILVSFVIGAIAAAVVGFFIYDEDGDDSETPVLVTYTDENGQTQTAQIPSEGDDWPPKDELPAFSW
jgi:hypothetical protein